MTAQTLQDDIAQCRALIRTGSLSFHAASRLLPVSVRDPALVLYAFCRLADDAVDEVEGGASAKARAVLSLGERLDRAYAGRPRDVPVERAFADLIARHDLPRALPEALLEGLAWDAQNRRPETLSDVLSYSARVASSVGAMMCVLMGVRDPYRLARACDLGLAMQLTNIARDIGDDARAGRLYLPVDWLDEMRIDPAALLTQPQFSHALSVLVRRLLATADHYYQRSEPGIMALPLTCRPGIFAARHIYAAIGNDLARREFDSVSGRAHTTKGQKLALLALSGLRSAISTATPTPATIHAGAAPECVFLVQAATKHSSRGSRNDRLIDLLADLRARDLSERDARGRLET